MNVDVEKLPAGGIKGGGDGAAIIAVEEANDSSSKFGIVRSGPLVRVDGNQVIDGKQVAIKYRTSGSSKCSV